MRKKTNTKGKQKEINIYFRLNIKYIFSIDFPYALESK